ncbi:non-specific lipid transfer protein GPI-anchored 25 isoform X2 [Macadamia integrifolia]|uniref:non-specific lipid transfer protein GPI-anchored 25 isoform X2 n=1 Tax=Macadamia integrifolia TaxID=60698 RepID=UPI001C4E841B|nr:non-specific lipid transfer protein GPI-anchored 25 isoform X2 [Macadamia integrifolia]
MEGVVDVLLVRIPARDLAPAVLALFLTLLVIVPASPTEGCINEITALSPCLPFISSPPNNISSSPPPTCCDVFSSAFNTTGAAVCYCYLLRQPSLLGFPLNATRFLSLSSLCSSKKSTNSTATMASLEHLCDVSPNLPPLQYTTGSKNSSAPSINLPPKSDASSPRPSALEADSSTMMPVNNSGPLLQPGIVLFLVPIFINMCCRSSAMIGYGE